MGRGMCKGGGSSIPDWLRIWEISKLSIASWIVAGSIGYVLCALTPSPSPAYVESLPTARPTSPPCSLTGIRPKWYPTIERPKAAVFTPKELEEWNQGKVGPHAESKR